MGSDKMDKLDEQILRAAKEIVVKFIETGRVSPAAFPETFRTIYLSVEEMAKGHGRNFSETEEGDK